MASVRLYENPGGKPMAMPGEVDVYMNPRKTVRVRGYSRRVNPMLMENPENPAWANILSEGSDITQQVSVVDVALGAGSFVINNMAVRLLGLRGWVGIAASSIVPFLTGSIAGMFNGRYGTAAFLGGFLDPALKVLGRVQGLGIGLQESGDDWVLKTSPGVPTLSLSAGASPLEQIQRPLALSNSVRGEATIRRTII